MGTNRRHRRLRVWAVVVSAAGMIAAGCDSADPQQPGEGDAKQVELHFESSATEVDPGTPVTLSWTSRNARSLRLLAGGVPLALGDAKVEEGSLELTPLRTTRYRLEAVGEGGATTSRELQIRVLDPLVEAPVIGSFSVSPEVFGADQPITLAWETTGATALALTDGAGRTIELGAFVESGSIEVNPLSSTIYTLVAMGAGGEASAWAQATLVSRPRALLWASEREIPLGASTTLRWEFEGATELSLYAGDAPEPLLRGGAGDELPTQFEHEPGQSTLYRLEVRGPGGTTEATEWVAVRPVIDAFTVGAGGPTRPGLPVELQWTIRGASSATISNRSGWSYEVPGEDLLAGSVQAPVGLGGSFVLVARSGGLESLPANLQIPLTSDPRIVELRFEPEAGITAGRGERGVGTLSWVVEGAEGALVLERIPGGFIDLVAASNRRGSVEVPLDGPALLRLSARNSSGQHQVELRAPVVQPPHVRAFTALPARVAAGETVELRWDVEDAAEIRLERDGVVVMGPSDEAAGSFRELLAVPATYTLQSTNALGFPGPAQSLQVELGAPLITAFSASTVYAQPGTEVRFEWSSLGGDHLELSTSEGGTHKVTELESIARGFVYLEAPASPGDYDYTLRVTNGGGAAEEQRLLKVTSLPVARSFTANPSELVVGGSVRFAWIVADGVGGETGRLELRDDLGEVFEISADELARGEKILRVDAAGDRTFTLHVIEDGSGGETTASAEVRIHGLPTVVSLTATPGFAEVQNQEVELAWRTQNAVSASLFALSPEGSQGALLCEARDAQAVEGGCTIRISKEWPDVRLQVAHVLGGGAERILRIGVQPATILSFSADPVVIPRGTSTTLRWETRFAEAVELGPRLVETDEPFLDLRSLGGTGLNLTNSGSRNISFPSGFTFPYFGRAVRELCVGPQGVLSLATDWGCYIDLFYGGSPDAFAHNRVDFGLFFHDRLGRPTPFSPDQDAFWLLRTDLEGRRSLIVQWSGFRFLDSSSVGPYNLNFQAHLHEDGRIEYRYGAMECISASCLADPGAAARVAGYGQVIGFHAPAESSPRHVLHLVPPKTEVPGGLDGRSFTFFPAQLGFAQQLEPTGSLAITPPETVDLTLQASNRHSGDQRSLRVEVYDYARLPLAWSEPAEPSPQTPFTLRWSVSDAIRMEVSSDGGESFLDTEDPAIIAGGTLAIPGLQAGDHLLTVRAHGRFGDQEERTVSLRVYPPYGIDLFEADRELTGAAGEEVVLRWETHGLQGLEIEASSGAVIVPPTANLGEDSLSVYPDESTTYTLIGESFGRTVSATAKVAVRSVRLDEVSTVEGIQWDRTPITLSWAGSGQGMVSITQIPVSTQAAEIYASPDIPQWEEVTGQPGKAFASINELPGTQVFPFASANTVTFPAGFTFPFGDQLQTQARLLLHGALSFNVDQGNGILTSRVPNGNPALGRLHLLPFSQGLRECILSSRLDDAGDPFIIQWSGCGVSLPAANPALLEFQVALFRNGDIEYRYGSMTATDMAYANGANALIGWQEPTHKMGMTLSLREAMAGDLGGRSWRARPLPLSGSFTVSPTQNTTYEICTFNATWRECVQRTASVVTANSIFPTEFMANPIGGGPRWIELRSVLPGDLDLRGAWIQFMISGVFTRHQISGPDPVVIRGEGGYVVLSDAPLEGLPPDVTNYVFGPELVINAGAGNDYRLLTPALSLNLGGTNFSWALPQGQSNELSGSAQIFPGATTFAQSLWCPTQAAYDTRGNKGTPGRGGASCGTVGANHYDVDWYAGDRFIDLRPLVGSGAVSYPALAEVDPAGKTLDYPGGLPFAFPFFGETLPAGQLLSISSNGFTSFASLASSYTGRITGKTMTSGAAPADGLLAPLFSYLLAVPESSFQVISTRTGGMNVLGLQWSDFTRYGVDEPLTFQLQLWENGDIVFAYERVPAAVGVDVRNVGIQSRIAPTTENIPMARTVLSSGRSILFKKK